MEDKQHVNIPSEEKTIKKYFEIEGIGSIEIIGELDFERLLDTLLDCKYITG